jgi:hypothetical protein
MEPADNATLPPLMLSEEMPVSNLIFPELPEEPVDIKMLPESD